MTRSIQRRWPYSGRWTLDLGPGQGLEELDNVFQVVFAPAASPELDDAIGQPGVECPDQGLGLSFGQLFIMREENNSSIRDDLTTAARFWPR
ncbi:MAG TPA: hypothetical protein DIW61_12495 [Candidatus Aminicenantes bacterium]|nr:hypothetical protein [Candidatus Aminicenantes bacterium]